MEFKTIPKFVAQLQKTSQSFSIAGEAPDKVELESVIRKWNGKSANDIPVIYLCTTVTNILE